MLTTTKEIEVSVQSARGNLGDQARGLESVPWTRGATILDIGCGPGVHLDYFRSKGLIGTGLDRNPDYFQFHGEIEHVTDIDLLKGRQFDYIFASHVLEHCPDTFAAILQWRTLLKDRGTMIIFVPPFWNDVSNDHWSIGWNVGQLAMTLVAAGFDCRNSSFYQTGNQVFGFGVKQPTRGSFMIDESLAYLPPAMRQGLYQANDFQNLRGDIAFVRGNVIEYLPRRSADVAVALPDDSWITVDREGWSDATAAPHEPLSGGAEYVLAVESNEEGPLRIAFAHDQVKEHGEMWMQVAPGLNVRRFELVELTNTTDGFDATKSDFVAIGGPTPFVRAALFRGGRRVV
jgi:SAM-dependent methyltransferase